MLVNTFVTSKERLKKALLRGTIIENHDTIVNLLEKAYYS